MTTDLHDRLHRYRSTLDDAIDADLAQRSPSSDAPVRHHRRLVGAAAAAAIAVVGLGALAWAATNSSDRSERSSDSAGSVGIGTSIPTPGQATPSPVPGPPTTRTGDRIAIGDSVMLDAAEQLVRLGFTVDALESRQFADVIDIVTSLADQGRIGDVIVINSSTNGPIQPNDLDAVMAELDNVAHVYVLTDAADMPWSASNNELIESLRVRQANVTVIDWASAAAECSGDCFHSDNLHLRPDGQAFYARLIHDATSEPATWTVDPDTIDASSTGFTAEVTRVGCASGLTGTVYPPTVTVGETEIEVTFRAAPLDPEVGQTCQSNDAVSIAVTLPEPIGERRLVDGVCSRREGAACEFGAVRWEPDDRAAAPEVSVSDTIFPPPVPVAEPVDLSYDDLDAVRKSFSGRRTVALERSDDGAVRWWMTVWTGITPSGIEVYCTATPSGGQTCVPDANVELRDPVQINGFSMEAPAALTLIAVADVTSLRVTLDDAEPIDIELVDVGVASGKQVAGLTIGDASTVRFDATLEDGSNYAFAIDAPAVGPAPSTAPTAGPAAFPPSAPRELVGD
jgi:hypothetical protein